MEMDSLKLDTLNSIAVSIGQGKAKKDVDEAIIMNLCGCSDNDKVSGEYEIKRSDHKICEEKKNEYNELQKTIPQMLGEIKQGLRKIFGADTSNISEKEKELKGISQEARFDYLNDEYPKELIKEYFEYKPKNEEDVLKWMEKDAGFDEIRALPKELVKENFNYELKTDIKSLPKKTAKFKLDYIEFVQKTQNIDNK